MEVSEANDKLAKICGFSFGTRAQFVRGVWLYIKKNKLQKSGNGRFFVPDKRLAEITGTEGKEMNGFKVISSAIEQDLALEKKKNPTGK